MKPIQEAITGKDFKKCEDESCQKFAALSQFYKAFNTRDMQLMEINWHNHENIAMDNPLGEIKRGWDEIKSVYERIFNGNVQVYVEFWDFTIIEMYGGFTAVGRERGFVNPATSKVGYTLR